MCFLLFCIMQADYDSMICSHNLRSSSALTFTSHHIPQTSRMRSRTRRITTHNLLLIPHTSLHLITFYNPVNQKETSSSQRTLQPASRGILPVRKTLLTARQKLQPVRVNSTQPGIRGRRPGKLQPAKESLRQASQRLQLARGKTTGSQDAFTASSENFIQIARCASQLFHAQLSHLSAEEWIVWDAHCASKHVHPSTHQFHHFH